MTETMMNIMRKPFDLEKVLPHLSHDGARNTFKAGLGTLHSFGFFNFAKYSNDYDINYNQSEPLSFNFHVKLTFW